MWRDVRTWVTTPHPDLYTNTIPPLSGSLPPSPELHYIHRGLQMPHINSPPIVDKTTQICPTVDGNMTRQEDYPHHGPIQWRTTSI